MGPYSRFPTVLGFQLWTVRCAGCLRLDASAGSDFGLRNASIFSKESAWMGAGAARVEPLLYSLSVFRPPSNAVMSSTGLVAAQRASVAYSYLL